MLTLLLTVLFGLVGSLAQADTSSSRDTKDIKHYGNCHVSTQVDMLTDAVSHGLICYEDSLTDRTLIGIQHMNPTPGDPWVKNKLFVTLSKGVQFHMDSHIRVAIRIDKDGLIRRTARWDQAQYAFIQDTALALQLLEQLAKGQRVAIEVGQERGHVRLNGIRAVHPGLQAPGRAHLPDPPAPASLAPTATPGTRHSHLLALSAIRYLPALLELPKM